MHPYLLLVILFILVAFLILILNFILRDYIRLETFGSSQLSSSVQEKAGPSLSSLPKHDHMQQVELA